MDESNKPGHSGTADLDVRELRPKLVRFAARLVGDADAEDVVQIALSKAADAIADFRGESSLRSWIYRIAANAAHDWNRARTRSQPDIDLDERDCEDLETEDDLQERHLIREEMNQCVGEVLRRIPESYQVILALSDCEELSDREIAEILGLSLGAAKVRLHRARTRMKQELEKACSFYRDQGNVLCCDRKQQSIPSAYPFDAEARQQVESRETAGSPTTRNEETSMSAVETLPTKQKHLIGIGAAIAAGCEPCTRSFAAAAREAGACERGVRFALENGLAGRDAANAAINTFADNSFARPELEAADREKRALLGALIRVAAAMACNAASELKPCVAAARSLGATDDQLRVAAQLGRTAKRGAEGEVEAAFGNLVNGTDEVAIATCCASTGSAQSPAARSDACGCGTSKIAERP